MALLCSFRVSFASAFQSAETFRTLKNFDVQCISPLAKSEKAPQFFKLAVLHGGGGGGGKVFLVSKRASKQQ